MNRIEKLKTIVDDMLSDSYSDQYYIADFVGEGHPDIDDQMDELAEESDFLGKLSKDIREQIKTHKLK